MTFCNPGPILTAEWQAKAKLSDDMYYQLFRMDVQAILVGYGYDKMSCTELGTRMEKVLREYGRHDIKRCTCKKGEA